MKKQNFFSGWWDSHDLQKRLVLVFTVLFVFCMVTLSIFLFNVVSMISYNKQARSLFEENRQVYQIEAQLRQYELGLKTYEISSSYQAKEGLSALGQLIDENMAALQQTLPEEYLPALQDMAASQANLAPIVENILQAVDEQDSKDPAEQDWSGVAQLDKQSSEQFSSLYAKMNAIATARAAELQDIRDEAEFFSAIVLFTGLLTIPFFLLLALVVSLLIYFQITLPMEQLAQAAKDLQARRFRPASLQGLAARQDEIGEMTREFIATAQAVEQRTSQLQQEAAEIRAKIK